MTFLDIHGIKQAFAEHMKKYRGYSEEEAAIAVSDFPDPYSNDYLNEDFVENCTIDGVAYEKNACYTTFWRMGLDDVPMFRFYLYYRSEDIPDHQVDEYMNARKLYQIDELDLDDFPTDTAKTHTLDFNVTVCLGGGDGGDVCVTVGVTEDEYELLKNCCREDEEIEDCDGLEDLCERIQEAAQDEDDFCSMDDDSDEEIDYDDVSYIIQMPDEIIDEINNEDQS